MKGLKEVIVGIGFLMSGVLGVAIGNLEETVFYSSNPTGTYKQSATYYLFMLFMIIGFIYMIFGFMKKDQSK